jgi:anthranilate phosphoribosyltransferase
MMREAIERAVAGKELDGPLVESAVESILSGQASAAQISAFLVAMRMKGETAEELAAAARVMLRHCVRVPHDSGSVVLDTCGTGGDALGTFNISTVSAIVTAACGVTVAKHGNRAASSKAGSADVLEALGVAIEMSPERVAECLRQVGIGFMFARTHHPAMRHAAPVRSELGIRTLFNLLGPLTNPAGATHQLLGVFAADRVEQMARVLSLLGSRGAWVVHGEEGMDEVSPCGATRVAQIAAGEVSVFELRPEDFEVERVGLDALRGGDAGRNAAIAREILAGDKGPRRDAVVINSAAALCAAGLVDSPARGAERATQALDSGAAEAKLHEWIEYSRAG